MLKIYFGRLEGVIKYPGRYFNNIFKPESFPNGASSAEEVLSLS